jgi:predicted nucleic acid-binding protein
MAAVFLDTGPLAMASNPRSSPENEASKQWLRDLVTRGVRVFVPEIADYEVRRELLRANKAAGVARLDAVKAALEYLPVTTGAMLLAAELWAQSRQSGSPTAPKEALDGDVILAAQALSTGIPAADLVVATVNVGHLARFVPAQNWRDIA